MTTQEGDSRGWKGFDLVSVLVMRDADSWKSLENKKSAETEFSKKNVSLDTMIFTNNITGEIHVTKEVQTVANHPNYPDEYTVAEGEVSMTYSTSSLPFEGEALVINSAETIDGRRIDENGLLEGDTSGKRHLMHANRGRGWTRDWYTARSGGCFMPSFEEQESTLEKLASWGAYEGMEIEGEIIDMPEDEIWMREE